MWSGTLAFIVDTFLTNSTERELSRTEIGAMSAQTTSASDWLDACWTCGDAPGDPIVTHARRIRTASRAIWLDQLSAGLEEAYDLLEQLALHRPEPAQLVHARALVAEARRTVALLRRGGFSSPPRLPTWRGNLA